MTAPITDRPMAPPTARKNWVRDVATPSSLRGTALCTAMIMGTMVSPMPTPASSTSRIAVAGVSEASQRVKSTNASARQIIPETTTIR